MGFEQLEAAQNKRQNAWQQLQTTKGKTKKVNTCKLEKHKFVYI
jgi:survival-of-motor-neuron-related-splicing factor 30